MHPLRSQLLEHLLPIVPFDGWSEYALAQAAKKAGISPKDTKRSFPGGINDCIDYYFESSDNALIATFPEGALVKQRVPDRIETLVMAKLAYFLQHREAVRRAVAQRALPWNMLYSAQSLYRSVDGMWRLAGDASTDFNFYTKRATLAGIYSATVLFWLNDDAADMESARAFLKRRLADVAAFGKAKKNLKDAVLKKTKKFAI